MYVVPYPPTGERWQVSSNGGVQPRWRADGRELFYLDLDGRLMHVALPTATRARRDDHSRCSARRLNLRQQLINSKPRPMVNGFFSAARLESMPLIRRH